MQNKTNEKIDKEGFRNHIKAWDSKGLPRDWESILKLAEIYNVQTPVPEQIEMIRMENQEEYKMDKFERWIDNHKKTFFSLVGLVYILLFVVSVGWVGYTGGVW